MSVFDTPYDPYAQAAARRASDVQRWVSQRAYERAIRAATDGPGIPTARGHRASPAAMLAHVVAATMVPRLRARHSAPAQLHH